MREQLRGLQSDLAGADELHVPEPHGGIGRLAQRRVPPRRVPALIFTALAVGLASAAYAAAARPSLLDQALSLAPLTREIGRHDLGNIERLSESRCGLTLAIERVFADPHLVLIAYSIRGPSRRALVGGVGIAAPTLVEQDGYHLLPAEAAPLANSPSNQTDDYWAFEEALGYHQTPTGQPAQAVWIGRKQRILRLHLTVPKIQVTERYRGAAPEGGTCERHSRAQRAFGSWWRQVSVDGPFTFAFAVPLSHDLRTADLYRAATADRAQIRLVRVELSATDTRIYLRLNSSSRLLTAALAGPPEAGATGASPSITIRRKRYLIGSYIGSRHGQRVYTFPIAGSAYHGPWSAVLCPGAPGGISDGSCLRTGALLRFTVP